MSLGTAILDTAPTSYWPLTDDGNGLCHDEMNLNDATPNSSGVKLAEIPFGNASVPYFDGAIGSCGFGNSIRLAIRLESVDAHG